jgi:hypothetical protein
MSCLQRTSGFQRMLVHNSRKKGSQSQGGLVNSWGRGLHDDELEKGGFCFVSFYFYLFLLDLRIVTWFLKSKTEFTVVEVPHSGKSLCDQYLSF